MFAPRQFVAIAAGLVFTGLLVAQTQPQTLPPGSLPPDSSRPTAPPMANPGGNPGSVPQDTQIDPYSGDKDFLKNVTESSVNQVQLGKLAADKGSSDAVKTLGKQMVEAHTETADQLKQAASALKIQMPTEPSRKTKKAEDKLAKLSGAEFDRAYAKLAADEQKQEVKQFEREAKDGRLPAMKDFAAKKLPAEQERQKRAEELAGSGTGADRQ